MISKSKIKLFNSLKLRKYRKKHAFFIAEGQKIISDLIETGIKTNCIITCNENFEKKTSINSELIYATQSEIKKITNLKTPVDTVAIFEIPNYTINFKDIENELVIFCDNIQNPGNFGTIIRTADWFGIKNIVCTEDTVDAFNPKVIQASMGAIGRVKVHYVNAENFFDKLKTKHKIYGTFLEGENIYKTELSKNGIIVIGNEGKGISDDLQKYISKKIHIPNYSSNSSKSESLNASIATAIVCAEFRRRE
ncbi:MAG: RNA methyltransferase [Chlorobi bacterium]|nr:RNA methyltransferase [Chlorobiota bacterium]